jgi:hypothetical protein
MFMAGEEVAEHSISVKEAELLLLRGEIDQHTMVTSEGLVEGWRLLGEVAPVLGLSEALEVTGSAAAEDLIGELTEDEALEVCAEMGVAVTPGEVTLPEMQAALRAHFSEAKHNPRKVFDSLDTDRSGNLSHEEVRKAASMLGLLLNKQQTADAFKQMDGDGSGDVSYTEFSKWLRQHAEKLPGSQGSELEPEPEPEPELPDYIRTVGIFRVLPRAKQAAVVALMQPCKFKPGDVIFREGDSGDAFFIVQSGQVVVSRGGVTLVTLGQGEYFGELALIEDDVRKASVHSLDESSVLRLSKDAFERNVVSDEVIDQTLEQFRDWSKAAPQESPVQRQRGVVAAGLHVGSPPLGGAELARAMEAVGAAARAKSVQLGVDAGTAAVLAWLKEDVVAAALAAAGGSLRLSDLDAVARACGGEATLDRAVRTLKRERKLTYDSRSWGDRTAVVVTWNPT